MAVPTRNAPVSHPLPAAGTEPVAVLRARARADADRFRRLAAVALRDGAPRGALRAANARAAARSVLAYARRMSVLAAPAPETTDA
ncbi:hypothetical protein [Methylobacterium sp. A54F]